MDKSVPDSQGATAVNHQSTASIEVSLEPWQQNRLEAEGMMRT